MKTALLVSLAASVAVLAGCGRPAPVPGSAPGAGPSLPPIKARVISVRFETVPALTEITGTVQAVDRAALSAQVMGAIETMPFTLGQRVKHGDVLVVIGAEEIKARVAQAQSQFNQVSRDLVRERELLPKGASTASSVQDLQDRSAGAEAMLREAQAMLSRATLRAPFDGVIAGKFARPGDLATPGTPLLELDGLNGFEVEAGVPDSLAGNLKPGMPLVVQTPADGVVLAGKISELSSAADPNAHTVAVKIAVPAASAVRSGQFVKIQIPGTPVRALLVPRTAVTRLGQMERVFVAGRDHRAVLRLVTTGAARGDQVEILSGLDEGDRVVLSQSPDLREGQPLEIQP